MICEHCGKNNHNSATVCRSCGEKLHRSEVRIPLRYGRTHRPGTEDAEKPQEAASPDEYFFDPTDYGDQSAYAGTPQQAAQNPPYPPAYPQQPQAYPNAYAPVQEPYPVRRKSRVPYLILSHLTALASLFCFVLPLWEWVSYHFQLMDWTVADGNLPLWELAKRFYESNDLVQFIAGEKNEMISSMVPASLQQSYTQGRIAALAVVIVFLIALVLLVLFILMVLFHQRRAAAGFGITAALLYGGACGGVMFAVRLLNDIVLEYDDVSWNIIRLKLLDAPYIGLGVAALVFVLCIIFAALGAGTDRRRRY